MGRRPRRQSDFELGARAEAGDLFSKLSLAPELEGFLTVPAYGELA
jgi:hypothetical protein